MFCPNCGNQLSDDSKFCDSCGASVVEEPVAQPEPAPQPEPEIKAEPQPEPVVQEPAPQPQQPQPQQPQYQQPQYQQPQYRQPQYQQPQYQQPQYQQPQYQQPQYQQPQYQQPQYMYVEKRPVPGRGLGIAGMVLGIISLVYAFAGFVAAIDIAEYSRFERRLEALLPVFLLTLILSVLGVSLAGAGKNKGYRTGISSAGIVTSIISLSLLLISFIIIAID